MKRWEAWLSHTTTITVAATGVAYFWMKYLVENLDPFSVVNHPWQSSMLSLHVVSAPVLVFVTGLIVRSHILKKLAGGARSNRRSGLVSMVALPLMIVSGYLLQVVPHPGLAEIVLVLHLGSSVIFVVTYIAHQIESVRLAKPVRAQTTDTLPGRRAA